MIQWGSLHRWWLLGIAAVFIVIVWYKYYARNRCAALLDKRGTMLKNFSPRKNIFKAVLASFGVLFLVGAFLHPKWGRIEEEVEQHGRDVFVALDISRSMLTQDCKPDRLTRAKSIIKACVDRLETDRVALLVFSEKSRVYCPLTKDSELLQMFVDQIDYTTIGSGTTRLDQPIQEVIDQCSRCPERKSRLLILLTDGEDFSGSLEAMKRNALEAGLTLLIVGVGTAEGAPIPLYNEQGKRAGYIKDADDKVVISQLNKGALQALAEETGGLAVMLGDKEDDVSRIVERVKQFEKEKQGMQHVSALQEKYWLFLLISFICFLGEWLL